MTIDTMGEAERRWLRTPSLGISRVRLEDAACRKEDLGLFFAVDGRQEEAKEICRRCAVRWQCLAYALETNQRYGVWGGMTPEERSSLNRKLKSDVGA
ncbi:MAG: WhiB family transcriptional regulator [Actinomycetota bacterium]